MIWELYIERVFHCLGPTWMEINESGRIFDFSVFGPLCRKKFARVVSKCNRTLNRENLYIVWDLRE